jgi:hypothetical protein
MKKDEFLEATIKLGLNTPKTADLIGVAYTTVKNWRSNSGPNPPIWAEKILRYEFKERGLEWPF